MSCSHGLQPYSRQHAIYLLGLAMSNLVHVRSKSKYLKTAEAIITDVYNHGIKEGS